MEPATRAIEGIGQVAIRVHDMQRAITFYRDVLDLPFLFQAGPSLAFFDCNGMRLMLDIPEDRQFDHPASILYYRVANLDAAFAKLVDRGVVVESEPHMIARMEDHELWMAFFHDSEDNVFAFMEERR